MKRREFLVNSGLASAGLALLSHTIKANGKENEPLMLVRYDTEWWGENTEMDGFIQKVVEVHRKYEIPVTLFCCGRTLKKQKAVFQEMYQEVKDDPLFDFQDHSFEHIGLCKKPGEGLSFQEIQDDYKRSFDIHEEVFGKRPIGIAMCGTKGENYDYFDSSESTKAEFEMLAGLGIKMINTHLKGYNGGTDFCNYESLGHPEIMGFFSGYSDTGWGWRDKETQGVEFMKKEVEKNAVAGKNMSVMLHDWIAWQHQDDKELSHLVAITEHAKKNNYKILTHKQCYEKKELWI